MDKLLILFGQIWLVGSILCDDPFVSIAMFIFATGIVVCGMFVKGEKDE